MKRLALLSLLLLTASTAPAAEPVIRFVDFEATVNPVSAHRIVRAIEDAEVAKDTLVLIQLDTPGGMVASMDEIVKSILGSEVPVVVWVGPAGARAASAGFFILQAADVAAMAPGTRTGAASTIVMGGENRDDDVLLKKANEDNAALCRSMTERRERNVEACREAVMEARAYEEQVALEQGLIDLIASDRDDLLRQLDGREVRTFDGSLVTLETERATFVESEFPWRQTFMEALTHPLVAFFLLLGGLGGIYIEFTHPGVVFPGVVGALCLLLFILSAQALPVSTVGILLILLAVVMFVLEIKVVSFGMLTAGGLLCLVLGSIMLIDGPIPEMRVPLRVVLPTSLLLAGGFVLIMTLAIKAQSGRVRTGVEGLPGEIGTVTRDLAPSGQVFVHGELWNAAASGNVTVAQGARVRIVGVDRMRLTVEPLDESSKPRS